ncbi:TPA: hypothetical protein N0F65_009059 [Lagenidium giganteum]|uniref:Uncharacterized protein n=1 Tax=Lagenidium giganteum TaxID=4803 RepID=A0AAV2YLJ6_9STRA|nr:TPA: hypothetical protein N0F65_009059 [Lagenidium giganteum]
MLRILLSAPRSPWICLKHSTTLVHKFQQFRSGIYKPPSREFPHEKPKFDQIILARILQHTFTQLTPEHQAYLDSPLTVCEFHDAINSPSAELIADFPR